MKLKSLYLKNFRSHADTKIDLDRINVFVGPGGAGKSSIKAAIEYLLTGRCEEWTGRGGQEADELIRHGTKKATIRAEIQPLGTVTRHIPNTLEVQAYNGTLTVLQETICHHLKADRDVISAMLNTSRFVEMTPDEQKKMLFALMGFKFNRDTVLEALIEYLKKTGNQDMVKPVHTEFEATCPKGLSGGGEVLDTLDELFKEERKAAKKTRDTLKTLVNAEAKSQLPEGVSVETKEEIVKQLIALRDRKSQVSIQLGQAKAAEQRDALAKRIETNRQELAVAEDQKNRLPQEDIEPYKRELPELKNEFAKVRATEKELQKEYDEASEAANALSKTMGTIYESGDNCPLALGVIKCTMTKEQKDKILSDLDGKLSKLKSVRSKAEKKLKDVQEKVKNFETKHNEVDVKIKEIIDIYCEGDRLEAIVCDLKKRILEDEKMLKELPEPVDTTALRAELEQLNQRIPKGEALVQAIILEESTQETRKQNTEGFRVAEARVGALEVLVGAFSAKGIKAEKLTGVIDKLQAKANERLTMLTGGKYQIKFDASEEFNIFVTKAGGGPTKLGKLSKSEKFRAGIVLQDILNSLTGLKLLVIDDADCLTPADRAMLTNMLMLVKDEYETIMAFSVEGEVIPVNPGIPDVAFFRVNEGTVTPIPVLPAGKQEGAVA